MEDPRVRSCSLRRRRTRFASSHLRGRGLRAWKSSSTRLGILLVVAVAFSATASSAAPANGPAVEASPAGPPWPGTASAPSNDVGASPTAFTVRLYTRENPPPTPALEDLPLQTSVTQHGITWTFADPARVGQFVNGDFYVVGPVTVVAVDPPPANDRNGSVLNLPSFEDRSGFDSRVQGNRYDPSMRANPPIAIKPGDALVSTISVETVGTIKRVLRPSDATISPVRTASVLTSLAAPVPPDAFRPSYADRSQKIYLSRDLQRQLLPRLTPVPGTPPLAEFEGYFGRPWIDANQYGFDFPIEYMPDYGREIGRAVSMASLLLTLDYPAEVKEPLLVYFVQYGVDLYGLTRVGYHGWPAHGGHGTGRKWPIVFAGTLFQDLEMQRPNAKFGEDMQTMAGNGWTGATALYAGHLGPDGNSRKPGWGPYEHLQPKDWVDQTGESYRRCCTSLAWVGEALAARLVHAEAAWNHPAFFDYVDRWMTEDDTPFVDIIQQQTGADYHASWARQGQAWDDFVEQMWAAYRDLADQQPVFTDVPLGHWANRYVEALFAGGYVAGCSTSPARYCPEASMTRGESSVFVVRGLHGGGFLPEQPQEMPFADVPLAEWFAKWVRRLWDDGYTAGCGTGPLIFCPLQTHNRAEGAVFMERMLHGKDFVPPQPTETSYDDVPKGSWYEKWVYAAYRDALVQECEDTVNRTDRRYRPEAPLTRAEAACMMAKAKGLP